MKLSFDSIDELLEFADTVRRGQSLDRALGALGSAQKDAALKTLRSAHGLMTAGDNIGAIKYLRQEFGSGRLGLKDAKDLVDRMREGISEVEALKLLRIT